MKKIIILFLCLSACSTQTSKNKINNDFDLDKLSFNQFSTLLNEYIKNNPYPDIEK
tara:strand:+ start:113 stop:280 length:168 start_codon:yes stop_codon:yes gene_type:complete